MQAQSISSTSQQFQGLPIYKKRLEIELNCASNMVFLSWNLGETKES